MAGDLDLEAIETIAADADNDGGGGSAELPMPRSIGEVIEGIDKLIGRLNSAASDGKRDSLEEVARRAKVVADAGGYRSPDLKDMPAEYQQAVEDTESSVIITTATMIQWARYACGEEGWDDGWGDVWMRMEAWRLELLKARIEVILGAR